MHVMPAEQVKVPPPIYGQVRNAALVLSLLLATALCACRLNIDDSTLALDAAIAPVVDQAADAYRSANTLHNLRQDYDAVAEFDATGDKVYNPRDIEVLLTDKDIAARLAVLQGFQLYAKSLCALVSGNNPKELGAASVSVGGQLSTLGNTLAPSIQKAVGIQAGASSTPPITPQIQNGISTAVDALGQFLIARKIKAELPSKIAAMDPHVQSLATLLESDIDVLKEVEHRDYDRIINLQTLSLRKGGSDPNSRERREEIMKLPDIVRRQREGEEKLNSLRAAVARLAKTHQQLVAEAQGKKPQSYKQTLEELAAAAQDLGSFYSSLPGQ
jgi:hypothetical protein